MKNSLQKSLFSADCFWMRSKQKAKYFLHRKISGMGPLEIVIIIGVLLVIAMLFYEQISQFAMRMFRRVFNDRRFNKL